MSLIALRKGAHGPTLTDQPDAGEDAVTSKGRSLRLTLVDNLLLPERGDLNNLDVHPHLGLLSLAAVARRGGHRVHLYDPKLSLTRGELAYDHTLYERVARLLADQKPDVVGFTTLGCSFIFSLKVARYLKRMNPQLTIMLGGPHATILHHEMLSRFPAFDLVVRHEAEDTLLPTLERLDSGDYTGIAGVTWRRGEEIIVNDGKPTVEDLDTLPMPAFDLSPIEQLDLSYLRVDAGRGCPFRCTFCSTASFFGRNYRLKSPRKLVDELDFLHHHYDITDFKLNHDLFTVDRKKVIAFCEAVKDRGYTWGVSARVDCVDEALLETMWDAGCRGIYFGIETGSERMQRIALKKLSLDLLEPTLDVTERLGMRTIVSFIAGYPQETQADLDATLNVLGRCFTRNRELFTTQLHMLTPEPGTQLYDQLGNQLVYDGYMTDFNASRLELDDEDIIVANPDIFVTYHYYPTIVSRARQVFSVDAYRILRKAGHIILTYALRFFKDRFAGLVAALYEWAQRHRWVASDACDTVTPDMVVAFAADTFGSGHHLTSLFRYAVTTEAARKVRKRQPARPFDPARQYRLASGAFLFRDLHNCCELVNRIEADTDGSGTFDQSSCGKLGCYLVMGHADDDEAMDSYALSPALHAIVELFASPRSFDEVSSAVQRATGAAVEPDVFAELVTMGALIEAETARAPAIMNPARVLGLSAGRQ